MTRYTIKRTLVFETIQTFVVDVEPTPPDSEVDIDDAIDMVEDMILRDDWSAMISTQDNERDDQYAISAEEGDEI